MSVWNRVAGQAHSHIIGFIQSQELRRLRCGQATVDKRAPIHYIIPINDMVQDPSKMFEKIPKNSTVRPFNLIYCGWKFKKISGMSILQLAHKQGSPSFHFYAPDSNRRYPCTQTASAVPKYFPRLPQFCTGYRIWHASRVSKRKTSEKRWVTHS